MLFTPPARTTLAQHVIDQLLSSILDGHLQPGDKLPSQQELVEQFQVGRSTIREAITTLVAFGLVESRRGRGTVVRDFDGTAFIRPKLLTKKMNISKAERLFEARILIEPGIAELAAQRATELDLDVIREVLDEGQQALLSGQPVHGRSTAFHLAVARAAHNDVLLVFVESIISAMLARNRLMEQQPDYRHWELESHRGVYQCIDQHDGERAKIAMAQHLEASCAAMLDVLASLEAAEDQPVPLEIREPTGIVDAGLKFRHMDKSDGRGLA